MTSLSIWFPIVLTIPIIFMFYTSGTIILELLKFKIKNSFSAIAAGFFTYFTFISVLTFPLQLISVLPYIFFIYFIWALTILFIAFCFVFSKYWLSTNVFSLNTIIYMGIVALIVGINFLGIQFVNNVSFARHKNTLSILNWLKDNPVSFFNNATLFNFLGFKPFQGWYTFQLSLIILGNIETYQYQDFIKPFCFIIDAFLFSSIFITMFEALKKKTKSINTCALFAISLIIFSISKLLIAYFDASFWGGESIFIYLVFYSIMLLLKYTTSEYRERNNTFFNGMVLGGYICFSWDSSYQVLFLLYGFIFVIQKTYSRNFTKDLLKLSIFSLIDIFFFNIVLGYYIQSLLFGILTVFLILTAFWMSRNYSVVSKFEIFIDQKTNFTILLLPISFMLISIAITLGMEQPFVSTNDNYLNFLYVWTSIFKNKNVNFWTTFILAMVILALSFFWIFIRKKIRTTGLTGVIDLILISYLTFYNPIVVKFINFIYPDMTKTNGVVMIVMGIVLLNVVVYWLFDFIKRRKVSTKEPVIIKKYTWLSL